VLYVGENEGFACVRCTIYDMLQRFNGKEIDYASVASALESVRVEDVLGAVSSVKIASYVAQTLGYVFYPDRVLPSEHSQKHLEFQVDRRVVSYPAQFRSQARTMENVSFVFVFRDSVTLTVGLMTSDVVLAQRGRHWLYGNRCFRYT
jgi:hypothetical protein